MNISATASALQNPYASMLAARGAAGRASAETSGQTPGETPPTPVNPPQDVQTTENGKQKEALSPAEQAEVRKLQQRDREVRQHEMAHLAASGGLAASGPTYSYQRGPDGVSYAIGGEVNINVSPGRTPQETIARAKTIAAAALAPANPSAQDRAVAAQARQMAQDAAIEESQARDETARDASDKASRQDTAPGIVLYRQNAAHGHQEMVKTSFHVIA